MKTKEFIKKVKEMGYEVELNENFMLLNTTDKLLVAYVNTQERYVFATAYSGFHNLNETQRAQLHNTLIAYARTAIEDREEPNRYHIKLTLDADGYKYTKYLNKYDSGIITLGSLVESEHVTTKFKKEEAEKLKQEIIDNLQIVEVE